MSRSEGQLGWSSLEIDLERRGEDVLRRQDVGDGAAGVLLVQMKVEMC